MEAKRVLLVDDSQDIRLFVRIHLEEDGQNGSFQVIGEATNGVEAVEMASTGRPDVVLLDRDMPVMDGLEAIGHIKSRSPNTKIIILSGFDGGDVANEAIALGADAYVLKADSPDALTRTILRVCR